MGTNYYIKIRKDHLDKDQADSMIEAYNEINDLLMDKAKSPNPQVEEWANEQLYNLSQNDQFNPYEKIHIGKNSGGHRFTLFAKFPTWAEWHQYLQKFKDSIVDEYDRSISLEDLDRIVKATLKNEIHFPELELSKDGYYISDSDFC